MDEPIDPKPVMPSADQSNSSDHGQEWPLRHPNDHRCAALWAQKVLEDLDRLIAYNLDDQDTSASSSEGID